MNDIQGMTYRKNDGVVALEDPLVPAVTLDAGTNEA
jgi:hypothetical protein